MIYRKWASIAVIAIGVMSWLVACRNTANVPPTSTPRVTTTAVSPPHATQLSNSTHTATIPSATTLHPLPLYRDATQPIEARIDDLLAHMTVDEKIGQMTLVEKGSIQPDAVTQFAIGGVLSGGGGGPNDDNTPTAWREMVQAYQQAAQHTRLAIPLLYGVDAVHGHSNVTNATIFPHNIGLGATGNSDLLFEIGRITAQETLATSIHWNYAPVLAVPQDVRWGRTYEGYSENSDLVAELGLAYFMGLQSVDGHSTTLDHPQTVLATPKHWVGDGGTTWGTSTRYEIDRGDTQIDEAELRQIHIAPYQAIIEQGALSVMVSYSSWNGTKMHGQAYLVNDVLKGELGFDGFVVSDWEAIDELPGDYYNDVVTAVNAGIDMNMVPSNYITFTTTLQRAVEKGDISMTRIDDAVRRILRAKFALGLFEQPMTDDHLLDEVGSEAHRALARQAVRQSLVLLKNDDALPLDKTLSRIFIAGQHGNNIGLQSGGWTIEWQGGNGDITEGTTFLEAVENSVSTETEVLFNRSGRFTVEAGQADVGFVVIGERPYAEGLGDSNDLTISTLLIERMRERADIVIVVLMTGRPLIISDALHLADAWVVAWLPGTEGAGITDVLFGEHEFVGKLPFTWQRTMAQLPFDFKNMPDDEGCDTPLFPFGYGLTYADKSVVASLDCSS